MGRLVASSNPLKWLGALLLVSVSLNIASVGFFVGRMAHDHGNRVLVAPQTIALQALPKDRLRQLLVHHSQSIGPMEQDLAILRQLRGELRQILNAERFNHRDFACKLKELTAVVARVHGHTNSSLVRISMHLTPGERRLVANMIERAKLPSTPTHVLVSRHTTEEFNPGRTVDYRPR